MISLLLLLAGPAMAELPAAFTLPNQADQLRQVGVPADQALAALQAMQAAGLSAEQATEVLVTSSEAVRTNGPVPQFHTLIQESLDAGLRGEELKAAIIKAHMEEGQTLEKVRQGTPAEGTGAPVDGGEK